MVRLLIHVEGQTEETFVNKVLAEFLYKRRYTHVSARLLGRARSRSRRSGICKWQAARRDIVNHLREDGGCLATMMVDFYALPQGRAGGWPGRETAGTQRYPQNAQTVGVAMAADISSEMGRGFNAARFIPYVVMHEFEALLFS